MQILRDCLARDAANRVKGGTPEDGRAAAPERRVYVVLARLNSVEEDALFMPVLGVAPEVLEAVEVVELLRPLHQCDIWVIEVAEHLVDKIRARNKIRVDNTDEFARRALEGCIDVACLGPTVVLARDILRP